MLEFLIGAFLAFIVIVATLVIFMWFNRLD